MKFTKSTGCTANWALVDDKDLVSIDRSDKKKIITSLMKRIIEDENSADWLLEDIISYLAEVADPDEQFDANEPCESCGDYVKRVTFNI